MKKVAKLIIIDGDNNYLMMWRSDHPTFGNDPDLPGGTLEEDESTLETLVREVEEEAGIVVNGPDVTELYSGADYSKHGTHYTLYVTKVADQPEVVISWEHSKYQWLSRKDFLMTAKNAKDTYMHMAYDVLRNSIV